MTNIVPFVIQTYNMGPGQQISQPCAVKDYAGNELAVTLVNLGDRSYFHVTRWRPGAAKPELVDDLFMPGIKPEGPWGSIYISGADLVILFASHPFTDPTPGDNLRPFDVMGWVMRGVAVPYPPNVSTTSGAGAPSPASTTATGGEDVDYDRIQAMINTSVRDTVNAVRSEFGGNVRQGIQDKSKDGVFAAYEIIWARGEPPAHTTPYQRAVRDSVWGKLGDRIYTTLRDWWPRRDQP